MKNKEIIIPVTFIVVAILFLYGGVNVRELAPNAGRYGPSFFPSLCASLLLFCSVMELSSVRKKAGSGKSDDEGAMPLRLFLLFGLSCGMPVLLYAVGFVATGLLGIFGFCVLIRIPWPKGLLLSVGVTLTIYHLFYTLLKVQLPGGLLSF